MANITGWGRGTWSQGAWDEPIPVVLTGESATGAVGSVTAIGVANVPTTGLQATTGVGSVTVSADANVAVTGETATASAGSVVVTGEANVFPTTVIATGAVGTATISGDANVPASGLEATTAVGSVTVDAEANIVPTGIELTTTVGSVSIQAEAAVSLSGVEATSGIALSPGPTFNAQGNAQLSTAQKKFGTASLLLDGTDDFVASDDNIDLSSGDFTVDMWIRPTSVTGYKGLWQSGTSSLLNVYLIGDQVQGTVAGSTTLFLSSTRISANVWTMISVEREGNVHRLYINGVLEQSSSTGNRPDNGVFSVGKNGFGDFNGYIDEVRLSTNARYTGSSFTEPTSDFIVDSTATSVLHFDGANGSTDIINARNLNNIVVIADANVPSTGLEGSTTVGSVTVQANADVAVTGVSAAATTSSGVIDIRIDVTIPETGFAITPSVGTVSIKGDADVSLTGSNTSATGQIGSVFVWGEIDPAQVPGWSEVEPSQSPTWTDITPSQSPGWDDIAA